MPGIRRALDEISAATVTILDVGSGPLTSVGKTFPGKTITVVATDPLAMEYVRILEQCRIAPPLLPIECSGEELLEKFPPQSFDIAFASNALDHSTDPVLVLDNMLALIRPTGRVVLMHFRNVGKQHGYAGLHFWNIDVDDGSLIFWNETARHDISARLFDDYETECWVTDNGERLHSVIRPRLENVDDTPSRRDTRELAREEGRVDASSRT